MLTRPPYASPYRCDDIVAHLDDYLDQEMPPGETQLFLEHLDHCSACAAFCQRTYDALAEMRQAIRYASVPIHIRRSLLAIANRSMGEA